MRLTALQQQQGQIDVLVTQLNEGSKIIHGIFRKHALMPIALQQKQSYNQPTALCLALGPVCICLINTQPSPTLTALHGLHMCPRL